MAKNETKYRVLFFQTQCRIMAFLIAFSGVNICRASGEPFPIGARSWGMGSTTVALADKYSVFNNPAGLGFLSDNFVSTSFHNRYQLAGLNTFALGGNYNTHLANIGLNVERFGDKLYHEEKLGLTLARRASRVALGVKLSYLQAAVENLAVKQTVLTEFGVMAQLSSIWHMGFQAYNLTGARLFMSQRVPTVLRMGLACQPGKQLWLTGEAEKDIVLPIVYKVGLEYQIVKNFYLRSGVTSGISNVHMGIGFQSKHFIFDYAASSHAVLGFSHHFSLALQLTNRKQKPVE